MITMQTITAVTRGIALISSFAAIDIIDSALVLAAKPLNCHVSAPIWVAFFCTILNAPLSINNAHAQKLNATTSSVPVRIERGMIDQTRRGVAQVTAESSSGSGFFVRLKGGIVCITNWHVVESALTRDGTGGTKQTGRITLRLASGREMAAYVWKSSQSHDIAVLRFPEALSEIVPLEIEEMLPPIGAAVFVWGAPYGEALVPLDGLIGNIDINRDPSVFGGVPIDVIQIGISVAPGNSGGPLLAPSGRVLGIISRRGELSGFSTSQAFAVASRVFWPSLKEFEVPPSPPEHHHSPIPEPNRLASPGTKLQPNYRPSPTFSPPPAYAPTPTLPPMLPSHQETLFSRAESQIRNSECREVLLLPPGGLTNGYQLHVIGAQMFRHLPLDTNRIRHINWLGPAFIEIIASPSPDGTPSLICIN